MAAVVLTVLGTLALAVLLAVFLPGAGAIAAVVIVALAGAAILWFLLAGAAGETPSDVARESEDVELLGPGGPDDPRRAPR
jgi:hypothetical protein